MSRALQFSLSSAQVSTAQATLRAAGMVKPLNSANRSPSWNFLGVQFMAGTEPPAFQELGPYTSLVRLAGTSLRLLEAATQLPRPQSSHAQKGLLTGVARTFTLSLTPVPHIP